MRITNRPQQANTPQPSIAAQISPQYKTNEKHAIPLKTGLKPTANEPQSPDHKQSIIKKSLFHSPNTKTKQSKYFPGNLKNQN